MRIVSAEAGNWSTGAPSRPGTGRAVRALIKASISVEFDSLGDEVVALFTLNFDASKLNNPTVTLGKEVPEGTTLTVNTGRAEDGQATVLVDMPNALAKGASTRIVTVTFDVVKGSPLGETPITFDGSSSLADTAARSLDSVYTDGGVTIKQERSVVPDWHRPRIGLIERIFTDAFWFNPSDPFDHWSFLSNS